MKPKYNRILLKLRGEALAGNKQMGLDYEVITSFGKAIKKCVDAGVEVGIVVGGGNFWRGRSSGAMDRTRADHIGMLATAMNALAVADGLENCGWEELLYSDAEQEILSFRPIQQQHLEQLKLRQTYSLKQLWLTEYMTRILISLVTL